MKAVAQIFAATLLANAVVCCEAAATPTCTMTISFPTGNGMVVDSQLGSGVCVQAQDKLFGNFSFGNLPTANGSVTFALNTIMGIDNHNITFTNDFMPGSSYTGFGYEVMVTPPPSNNSITDLFADFTQTTGGPTTLTETTTPGGVSGSINLSKTGVMATGTNHIVYAPPLPGPTDLIISENLSVGTGGNVSAILNTVIEQIQTTQVPEPGSLALLGSALIAAGAVRRRRQG